MRILNDDDLRPASFSVHMREMLDQKKVAKSASIEMNGAANAAEFLNCWGGKACR